MRGGVVSASESFTIDSTQFKHCSSITPTINSVLKVTKEIATKRNEKSGSNGSVYETEDGKIVKILKSCRHLPEEAELYHDLSNEVNADKYLVKLLSYGTDKDGDVVLIMEKFDGIDLQQVLQSEIYDMSDEIKQTIINNLIVGLNFIHKKGSKQFPICY
jgi:serine/threonine protein kinase